MEDVIVIGAGPYGLSIASHLKDAGCSPRIIGTPMGSWRNNMPAGMHLKSTPRASSLSAPGAALAFEAFRVDAGRAAVDDSYAIPIEEFIDYGDWFRGRSDINVEEDIVKCVERDEHFDVSLECGEHLEARAVVVAVGHVAYASIPSALRALNGCVSHSASHADFYKFSGKRVAVVGGGQSALESAVLLAAAGAEVFVLVRAGNVLWGSPPDEVQRRKSHIRKPASGLGPGWSLWVFSELPQAFSYLPRRSRLRFVDSVLGPSGAWWMRERFEGAAELHINCAVRSVTANDRTATLELDVDGRRTELVVDHVIAATGYDVDVAKLRFLAPPIQGALRRCGNAPALDRHFQSSVRGLYFAGLTAAPTFGPVQRFVYGTRFAAPRIARAIARSSS